MIAPLFRASSISSRIALISLLLNGFVLVVVGLYLSASYRQDVISSFDGQLDNYGRAILTEISEVRSGRELQNVRSPDPRFNTPLSGWYWQLMTSEGELRRTSRSLFGTVLEGLSVEGEPLGRLFTHRFFTGPGGEDLRLAMRSVTFNGDEDTYVFVITGDFTAARLAASRFMRNTLLTLLVIGLLLSASTFALVRWGLTPLRLVGTRLQDIREGRSSRLGAGFADEIAPLAGEVDSLLDYNEKLIERARRHVGNLAHGLKTPLAVLANHARAGEDHVLQHEVGNMQRQIDHHLSRARIAATSEILRPSVEAGPALDRLVRTLRKIYPHITIHFERADRLPFKGDIADFEDIAGNLADNACKWAKQAIWISAVHAGGNQRERIELLVEDDGPGLSAEDRALVLKRGVRLDEMKPGSGLGLSIVTDLTDLYNGSVHLGESGHGGLAAKCILPGGPLTT